jgi:hypothetical protein
MNAHPARAIEYLREENRVLRQQLEGKRLRLTVAQRRRLAGVEIAGITPTPDTAFMRQFARCLRDSMDGFPVRKRLVIMDRDEKFRPAFRAMLRDSGIEPARLPARSPDLIA